MKHPTNLAFILLPFLSTSFVTHAADQTCLPDDVNSAVYTHSTVDANSANYTNITVDRLNLNRTARKLSSTEKKDLHGAHTGFIWANDDNQTDKWRPQGITGFQQGGRSFLAVSWYAREVNENMDYGHRGTRISFVDVTSMDNIRYRHVLLVDESDIPFADMHAGGLAYREGKLYVPDSRGSRDKIHVFDLSRIKEVPSRWRCGFYSYVYILKLESTQDSLPYHSGNPSFLSFDRSRNQFLSGQFDLHNADNLYYFNYNQSSPQTQFEQETHQGNFYTKMQGAVSDNGKLWIATSYGRTNKSELYHGDFVPGTTPNLTSFTKLIYPAGLEDMHLSTSNIWMLTEFTPKENGNNRIVFATRRSKF